MEQSQSGLCYDGVQSVYLAADDEDFVGSVALQMLNNGFAYSSCTSSNSNNGHGDES
jgi:hypothetical protein